MSVLLGPLTNIGQMVAYLCWIRQLCNQQRRRVKSEGQSEADCERCSIISLSKGRRRLRYVLMPLAPINMPIEVDDVWSATPASMKHAPINNVGLRPRLSEAIGEKGRPTKEPITWAALMRPTMKVK